MEFDSENEEKIVVSNDHFFLLDVDGSGKPYWPPSELTEDEILLQYPFWKKQFTVSVAEVVQLRQTARPPGLLPDWLCKAARRARMLDRSTSSYRVVRRLAGRSNKPPLRFVPMQSPDADFKPGHYC